VRLALFLLQATCVSQPAKLPSVDARWNGARERARAIACEQLAPNIPGFAIAVAVDGRLVWSEAFGYTDLEGKRQTTTTTQFRIGSVSKPLTADAVAQLFESGKLDLDAPVQRYVRHFPTREWPSRRGNWAGISPAFVITRATSICSTSAIRPSRPDSPSSRTTP
jgi:serine beta-lactamase-like protein LACTB